MGMFDTITVKAEMPESWPKDTEPVFQTKDLECLMFNYEVREDNKLYIERVKYKTVEQRSTKKGGDWLSRFPTLERESSEWEFAPATGYIVFYTSVKNDEGEDLWLEYRAHIVSGVVLSIEDFKDCKEGDMNSLPLFEDLSKTRDLVQALATAQDHYFNSFLKRHNLEKTDAEDRLFDYCFNDFGTIETIKTYIK
jgi:hypothetical protein